MPTARARRRPGPRQRGYDKQWEIRRARHLAREPFCRHCAGEGWAGVAGEHVDHVIPARDRRWLFDADWNLQTLCAGCHRAKSASEIHELPDLLHPTLPQSHREFRVLAGPDVFEIHRLAARRAGPADSVITTGVHPTRRSLRHRNERLTELLFRPHGTLWLVVPGARDAHRRFWDHVSGNPLELIADADRTNAAWWGLHDMDLRALAAAGRRTPERGGSPWLG